MNKYFFKCLKIEINVLQNVFKSHTLWVFPHLNVSTSVNNCHFPSHPWIAINCYLNKLFYNMTLKRQKFRFSLPQGITNYSHVESVKIFFLKD